MVDPAGRIRIDFDFQRDAVALAILDCIGVVIFRRLEFDFADALYLGAQTFAVEPDAVSTL